MSLAAQHPADGPRIAPEGPRRGDLQRRVLRTLATGQVLGGIGTGASVSLGSLLLVEVSGSTAWSGLAATTGTLGAAVLAMPLAHAAVRRGRRLSLALGAGVAATGGLITIGAAAVSSLPLVLAGLLLLGASNALNLQARFAATDHSDPARQGRDLSLVVWSTTLGVVLGPNLFEPGEMLGAVTGLPELTGGFAISVLSLLLGLVVYVVGLRGTHGALLTHDRPALAGPGRSGLRLALGDPAARRAVLTIALSHAVMVALMGMTPVHMSTHGMTLTVVGVTVSLHMASMYALAPMFGALTDRFGGTVVVLLGQVMLGGSLAIAIAASGTAAGITASLILLGLGWSAATVAGSTMVTRAAAGPERAKVQGASDVLMNVAGALGGAAAGPVLALIGFSGLAAALLGLVVITILLQGRAPGSSAPTSG